MDPVTLTGWSGFAILLCTAASYCLRRFAAPSSYLHSAEAQWLIAGGSTLLAAATKTIELGGLSWVAMQPALIAAAMSWLAQDNPSIKALSKTKPDLNLVPLFLIMGLGMSACAGGMAFGKCELGLLPQTLQGVIADVSATVANSSTWEAGLAALGLKIGPDQLNCVVQAIAADFAGKGLKADRGPSHARLREWMSKHPSRACR